MDTTPRPRIGVFDSKVVGRSRLFFFRFFLFFFLFTCLLVLKRVKSNFIFLSIKRYAFWRLIVERSVERTTRAKQYCYSTSAYVVYTWRNGRPRAIRPWHRIPGVDSILDRINSVFPPDEIDVIAIFRRRRRDLASSRPRGFRSFNRGANYSKTFGYHTKAPHEGEGTSIVNTNVFVILLFGIN